MKPDANDVLKNIRPVLQSRDQEEQRASKTLNPAVYAEMLNMSVE